MRILFLTPWYPDDRNPHYGVFVRDQAVAMAANHEVMLVCSRVDYGTFGFLSFTTSENVFRRVTEHRILIRKSFPIYNQVNYFMITAWYTWKVARAFKPEIIHGNIGFPGAFWSWIAGKLLGVPYVITEHATRFSDHFRSGFHRLLTIPFMKKASAIIAVSQASATDIFTLVNKQPIVIPNIIVVENFRDVVTAPGGETRHFGFLGGLEVPRKGLDILLRAAAGVRRGYVMHIGGKGKLLNEYKSLARELGIETKCAFYGFIPEGDVPAFMSKLHFFVSASRAEGFGMVIAEALACGLPVLSTRSGGPEDFVIPENGRLVPPGDVQQLKEALEWMMENYASFDKTFLRAFVTRRFSPPVVAAKISEVYAGVIRLSRQDILD